MADNKNSKEEGRGKECRFCVTKQDEEGAYVITNDLIKDVSGTNKAKSNVQKLEQFLRRVNSMLNKECEEGSASKCQDKQAGKIYLHTEYPHLLGEFDKKVDERLVNMAPNGLLFQDIFHRYFYDEKHVVFEIIPLGREHSTLDFCTKVSLNKGLSYPTHAQMYHFLSRDIDVSAKRHIVHKPVTFVNGEKVKMKAADQKSDVPFQESSSLQAKPSKEKYRLNNRCNRVQDQVNWWWNEQGLSQYISAFSKLPSGGSIFLGVREEVDSGKQTGIFKPHSIVLNQEDCIQLKKFLQEKISNDLFAVPIKKNRELVTRSNPNLERHSTAQHQESVKSDLNQHVHIHFHKVFEGAARDDWDDYVVEVEVTYYPGLCFYKKDGPESYTFKGNRPREIEKRVSREKWVRLMKVAASPQEEDGPSTSAASPQEEDGPSTSKKAKNQ